MRRNQRDKTHCSHEGTPNSASNIRARFDEGKMVQRDSRVTLCARFVSRRRLTRPLVRSETVKKKCRLDRSVKWTSPLERHVATSLAGYCSRRAAARCCCSAFWRAGKRTEQHENLLLLSFSLFTECADEAKLFFLSTTQTKKLGAAYHQI